MNDLNNYLASLVKGSTEIISNPKTIEEMQKKGVKFDSPTVKTINQIIDELFDQRKNNALDKIKKFPEAPQIAIPTINFLYNEIRECILFGLNGAAISLSAVLIEFALKHAIIKKLCGKTYSKQEWDRLEKIELGPTINEASQLKLVDNKTKKALIRFKNKIRNPYLHYNIKRITEYVVAKRVKKIEINTKTVQELDIRAKDNPIIWNVAKRFVDRRRIIEVFLFADKIIKYLFEKV